jgi:signal peptidase
MKLFSRIVDIILYCIVGILFIAALFSGLWDKPVLLTSVRSNSMYPLFQRGNMLAINSLNTGEEIVPGDIVVFKAMEGELSSKGWIVHRVIGGDKISGYITKGDANAYTDQSSSGGVPIQREWITGKVVMIGEQPLKIPFAGYLPLWMEKFQSTPYAMPLIVFFLAAIVGFSEIASNKKGKRRKRKGMELQLVYFLGGLTVSIIVAGTMLNVSQRIIVPYQISESGSGVLMGSSVGVLEVGDEITRTISELENKGFFPFTATVTTTDHQMSFQQQLIQLKPGDHYEIEMKLTATEVGGYQPTIYIGLYYPFLPRGIIYRLATHSYFLALVVVSLIPGLPLMLYPVFDQKLRRKTQKEIRRFTRRIRRKLPNFHYI